MNPISGLLQSIPLLSALSERQLEAVTRICERCTYEAEQPIVTAGEQAEAAYFLIDGQVDCLTKSDTPESPDEMISTAIPSGATLLELAMIVELDVSATCIARGSAKVLKIPRQAMHDLMQDDIALTDTVIETLTVRLREMADTMREASAPFAIGPEEQKRSA